MEEFEMDMGDVAIDVVDVDVDVEYDEFDSEGISDDCEVEGEVDMGESDPEKRKPRKVRRQNPKQMGAQGKRPKRPSVKDYLSCSLFTKTCCNAFGFGLMALLCSLQVRKKLRRGDVKGAKRCAWLACRTNVVAVLITICTVILISVYLGLNVTTEDSMQGYSKRNKICLQY
ncbi:hypothetical protein JZ751_028815 [Albula glossodonta]|uniref:Uncharacterized protein n=1 Tax=Albula glossodonta TaxID=121402 RepID=A0A8T2NBP6_9TELE|nr:hypothetical protein JZ751_028815 [Albula glossodonta]